MKTIETAMPIEQIDEILYDFEVRFLDQIDDDEQDDFMEIVCPDGYIYVEVIGEPEEMIQELIKEITKEN